MDRWAERFAVRKLRKHQGVLGLAMPRVLEGIMTSVCEYGGVNISPMGPVVEADMQRMMLRPYQMSTTFANLKRTRRGVFHVTDDCLLLARAATGQLVTQPPLQSLAEDRGFALLGACRWYAVEVESVDETQARAEISCRVVAAERQRDFFGFNRAKHAVLEAAILATRTAILPAKQIRNEMDRLASPVEKTGGPEEKKAFGLLSEYISDRVAS